MARQVGSILVALLCAGSTHARPSPPSERPTTPGSERTSKDTRSVVPRILFVQFTDGTAPNEGACSGKRSSPFSCGIERVAEGCEQRVVDAVRKLYSGLGLSVTRTRPTGEHMTIVVSSENGGWCGYDAKHGGIAPIDCGATGRWGRTGFVFSCTDIEKCAVRVAQESAHLLGLDHTADELDIMFPFETDGNRAFRDVPAKTINPRCGKALQSSRAVLSERLSKASARSKQENQ